MRVVHTEDPHAAGHPEAHDVAQRLPQLLPVWRIEIERVDVLVLLGRVLRVSDRAVGTTVEPVRMFAHPGVVGRALNREVERNLHAQRLGGAHESIEILERAEGRLDRGMATMLAADRPRTAGVSRPCVEAIVRTLPSCSSDRMDGRQIHDVKPHTVQVREPLLGVAKCSRRAPDSATATERTARTRSRSGLACGQRSLPVQVRNTSSSSPSVTLAEQFEGALRRRQIEQSHGVRAGAPAGARAARPLHAGPVPCSRSSDR